MRMELTSSPLIFNPVAQVKFVPRWRPDISPPRRSCRHFFMYLLRARDVGLALRSFAVAPGFGLASTLCLIVLGDESGYTSGEVLKGNWR